VAAHESAELHARLRGVVEGAGLYLDSVRELAQNGTPVIRVVVDAVEGTDAVDSDTLAQVSRAVSQEMDRIDPVEGKYLLEVSTPGAERELTQPRHWRRQIGRLVHVRLRDGRDVTGRLVTADEESATLDVEGRTATIAYAQVKKARPRVEFVSDSEE